MGDFYYFLISTFELCNNTALESIKRFHTFLIFARKSGEQFNDPFDNFTFRFDKVDRGYLDIEELQTIMNQEFKTYKSRLEKVRDMFVFSCFTGLAFIDVKYLTHSHITKDNQGEYWIRKPREKTNNMSSVPLLEIPLQIIEKYRLHPECESKGILLPVPSNQRMNSYLKEIADACGINKNLSTHVARHTFACLALANNITIDSISKMLGHTDIRTTRIYARVLDKTISTQMKNLSGKFTL
ncbi:MAG: site-specific integrase [Tannerellaceae bacterium]|nr:site-specific integrase [Tannerellaceae bacterium]